jgi:hypothetical protein
MCAGRPVVRVVGSVVRPLDRTIDDDDCSGIRYIVPRGFQSLRLGQMQRFKGELFELLPTHATNSPSAMASARLNMKFLFDVKQLYVQHASLMHTAYLQQHSGHKPQLYVHPFHPTLMDILLCA